MAEAAAQATAQVTAQAVGPVAVVARELEPQLGTMCTEMVNLFFQKIPALRSEDEDLRELLSSSIYSNVATATSIYMHSIPLEQIEPPTAAAHYARRLAQREVPLDALLRAYHLGEGLYLQYWFRLVERHQPDAKLLMAVIGHTATIATGYIDRSVSTWSRSTTTSASCGRNGPPPPARSRYASRCSRKTCPPPPPRRSPGTGCRAPTSPW